MIACVVDSMSPPACGMSVLFVIFLTGVHVI